MWVPEIKLRAFGGGRWFSSPLSHPSSPKGKQAVDLFSENMAHLLKVVWHWHSVKMVSLTSSACPHLVSRHWCLLRRVSTSLPVSPGHLKSRDSRTWQVSVKEKERQAPGLKMLPLLGMVLLTYR